LTDGSSQIPNISAVPLWLQSAVTVLGVISTVLVGVYGFMRKKAHEDTRSELESRDNSALLRKLSENIERIATLQERIVALTERNVGANAELARRDRDERESTRIARIVEDRIGHSRHEDDKK
jgi:Rad3-related DNA helicase